jgi:hypothetical protein
MTQCDTPRVSAETMQQICIVGHASPILRFDEDDENGVFARRQMRKFGTHIVPPASWQLANGKSVTGLLYLPLEVYSSTL